VGPNTRRREIQSGTRVRQRAMKPTRPNPSGIMAHVCVLGMTAEILSQHQKLERSGDPAARPWYFWINYTDPEV